MRVGGRRDAALRARAVVGPRPSLRAQRSNPDVCRCLDCFVAALLAMTTAGVHKLCAAAECERFASRLKRRPPACMSIRAAIHHLTHYKYDRPVSLGPADHPAPARAPQPHPRHLAFAEGLAGRPFREPPAGPVRQLARPLRVPGTRQRVQDRGRRRRRHDGLQSVRLLRRGERRALAVRLRRGPEARSRHLPDAGARRPAPAGLPRRPRPVADAHGRFPRRTQPKAVARRSST